MPNPLNHWRENYEESMARRARERGLSRDFHALFGGVNEHTVGFRPDSAEMFGIRLRLISNIPRGLNEQLFRQAVRTFRSCTPNVHEAEVDIHVPPQDGDVFRCFVTFRYLSPEGLNLQYQYEVRSSLMIASNNLSVALDELDRQIHDAGYARLNINGLTVILYSALPNDIQIFHLEQAVANFIAANAYPIDNRVDVRIEQVPRTADLLHYLLTFTYLADGSNQRWRYHMEVSPNMDRLPASDYNYAANYQAELPQADCSCPVCTAQRAEARFQGEMTAEAGFYSGQRVMTSKELWMRKVLKETENETILEDYKCVHCSSEVTTRLKLFKNTHEERWVTIRCECAVRTIPLEEAEKYKNENVILTTKTLIKKKELKAEPKGLSQLISDHQDLTFEPGRIWYMDEYATVDADTLNRTASELRNRGAFTEVNTTINGGFQAFVDMYSGIASGLET